MSTALTADLLKYSSRNCKESAAVNNQPAFKTSVCNRYRHENVKFACEMRPNGLGKHAPSLFVWVSWGNRPFERPPFRMTDTLERFYKTLRTFFFM
ncbi:hypothetical protein CDAR_47571 [Caerostris darwini]|uniref:Uncharacterized protein n=1 Tax=Caerostris darwini TaxID=1538125 RepID=A0AAV4MA49_9ARAC|nr:hypothetical protein CDAR_47571 [Caerostris darwini]